MQKLAAMFKALSEETRLQIMALLTIGGELCVCDFEGVLKISQSKSSRHLRYLYNAGLVLNRRAGKWMYYRLPESPDPTCAALLAALPDLVDAELRAGLAERLDAWIAEKEAGESAACAVEPGREAP